MSKANPLAGLISYGDSDEGSDDESIITKNLPTNSESYPQGSETSIRAAPIQNCPWSACYDETTGFTYYWNQVTNAVTWEAPPEYLLALKLAQSRMKADVNQTASEVSTEEWQLYQQVLAEKQIKQTKDSQTDRTIKIQQRITSTKHIVASKLKGNDKSSSVKRKPSSDDEDVKIELITSYSNSDSESNDEREIPKKPVATKPGVEKLGLEKPKPVERLKNPHKKLKTKSVPVEYGPPLPLNQDYAVPIGPELPPNQSYSAPVGPELPKEIIVMDEDKPAKSNGEVIVENSEGTLKEPREDQEELALLKRLKEKAKLLEKLGGELPTDVQKFIKDGSSSLSNSRGASPIKEDIKIIDESSRDSKTFADTNIDDLLDEIEKKELPKVKKTKNNDTVKSNHSSAVNSPKISPDREIKSLFPSAHNINEEQEKKLFPSSINIIENDIEDRKDLKSDTPPLPPEVLEKKGRNLYLMDVNEKIENTNRKKLRISNSVLPERKIESKPEIQYTTKYSQYIEGFSNERVGLGFKENDDSETPKINTINYGKGLMFTKGETLNEDKKDEELDDLTDLLEAKLKFLNQLQPCAVAAVQEMLIQMQTLVSALRAGSLSVPYWRAWAGAAASALTAHEASAAPAGWKCCFSRSEGRYQYTRELDGFVQWEYPATTTTDMEICTTPPPPEIQPKEPPPPPLPPSPPPPPACPPTPPPPAWTDPLPPGCDPPPPGCDPPPPGCDPLPPMSSVLPKESQQKQVKDDVLLSFYNDIAELEKQTPPLPTPATMVSAPVFAGTEHPLLSTTLTEPETKEVKKKKSKVKISTSLGRKQKTVSTLVAKWQQVAEEIHDDIN